MNFDDLFSPVNKIKGVGPIISKKLLDKGITNKIDLFLNLPTGAIDRRFCPKLDQLEVGKVSTIFVTPIKYNIPRFRNLPNKVTCKDEYGQIDIIFFNSRENYIKQILPLNNEVIISGKVNVYKNKFQITNPEYIQSVEKENDIKKIMAKYSSVTGISAKTIQKIYNEEIKKLSEIDEWHEKDFIKKLNWPTWYESIFRLHNPENLSDIDKESKFYKRLAYDEIFSNFLIFSEIKKRIKKLQKKPKNINNLILSSIKNKLSFQLTQGQEKVLDEIFNDLSSEKKMLRVLQGDVGSGKTVVAMLAATTVVLNFTHFMQPLAGPDLATPSCAAGAPQKSVCGWISSTWTAMANRTADQPETKTAGASLTFTTLNRSQRWWICPTSAIPMNPFILSPPVITWTKSNERNAPIIVTTSAINVAGQS